LLRHAYAWMAETLTFDVVVEIEPVGSLGALSLGGAAEVIAITRSSADVKWGHLSASQGMRCTRVLGRPEATGLRDDQADLLVWAPPALALSADWQQVLREARRVVRPDGLVALILDDASASKAVDACAELGFPNNLRIDHRPMIGSVIGWPASITLAAEHEPAGSGAILLLGAAQMPALDAPSSISLEHGERGRRLEISDHPLGPLTPTPGSGSSTAGRAAISVDEAALRRDLARSEDRATRAEQAAASAAQTLAKVEAQLISDRAAGARAVQEARQHTEMLMASPSWRLTAPLRRFKRSLRR
jgi:Methyltransferase domain